MKKPFGAQAAGGGLTGRLRGAAPAASTAAGGSSQLPHQFPSIKTPGSYMYPRSGNTHRCLQGSTEELFPRTKTSVLVPPPSSPHPSPHIAGCWSYHPAPTTQPSSPPPHALLCLSLAPFQSASTCLRLEIQRLTRLIHPAGIPPSARGLRRMQPSILQEQDQTHPPLAHPPAPTVWQRTVGAERSLFGGTQAGIWGS